MKLILLTALLLVLTKSQLSKLWCCFHLIRFTDILSGISRMPILPWLMGILFWNRYSSRQTSLVMIFLSCLVICDMSCSFLMIQVCSFWLIQHKARLVKGKSKIHYWKMKLYIFTWLLPAPTEWHPPITDIFTFITSWNQLLK